MAMENKLPKGWVECRLGDLCTKPQYGWTTRATHEGSVKYLRTTDISNGYINWATVPYCVEEPSEAEKYQIGRNDILVSRAGSVGYNLRVKENIEVRAAFASYLIRFKPYNETISKYISYYLKSAEYWNQIADFAAGIAIPNVNATKLEQLSIPLAPLAEQQRIVARLDALFEKIESNKKRLERLPKILHRFRQTVLSAGMTGRLTEEWRLNNGISNEWRQVKVREVIPKGGLFDGPFGSSLKTKDYTEKGVRVIRLENIEHLRFVEEKETYISEEKYSTLIRHTVKGGDIIFSSFISDEVRVCLLPNLSSKAIAKADCFCIRPDEAIIDKYFLIYALTSQSILNQLQFNIHGATRPRINTSQLKELQIPFPSIEEQREVVRKVEQFFGLADKIIIRRKNAEVLLSKLSLTILSKAFMGELIPQDSYDEPASVLLERIRDWDKSSV